MVKIDRTPYINSQPVQKLIQANPIWDGQGEFKWKVTIENECLNVRRSILPVLLEMTKRHCSFCDFYPLSIEFVNPIPIEHFYPKSKYPEKAYSWDNLFPVCNGCTSRKEDLFDEKLIKPDESSYSFESYFKVNGDGKIQPSEYASELEKERAKITIDIYKLNIGILVSERRRYLMDYEKLAKIAPVEDIDDRPYRFLISIVNRVLNVEDFIKKFIHD